MDKILAAIGCTLGIVLAAAAGGAVAAAIADSTPRVRLAKAAGGMAIGMFGAQPLGLAADLSPGIWPGLALLLGLFSVAGAMEVTEALASGALRDALKNLITRKVGGGQP